MFLGALGPKGLKPLLLFYSILPYVIMFACRYILFQL